MFGSNKVRDLTADLSRIEQTLPGPASRNPRLGFRKTIAFLEKYDGMSVEQLQSKLAVPKKTIPKKSSVSSLRRQKVDQYVNLLQSAGLSVLDFNEAFNSMKSDKQVRLLELKAIVAEYAKNKSSFSKKDVGYGIIQQIFDQRWKIGTRRG